MTRLGDVNRFGAELELDEGADDERMFGRILFWAEAQPIGEWEVTSLRDVMNQLARIHADRGQRQSARFIDTHPFSALEMIYGAGSERWQRIAVDEQWARHKVLPRAEVFGRWNAVLIEDDAVARLIVRREGDDVREHRLEVGDVDRVFALVLTELEALHAQALARRVGLRVDVRTVVVRSTGPATGDVCITLNGEAFPSDGWNDFLVPIYAAWTNALARLLRGSTVSERVSFMDGPYELRLVRTDADTVCVNGVENFSIRELAENAVMFANGLHQACQEQRFQLAYSPGDVLGLEMSLYLLRSVLSEAFAEPA